MGTNYYVSPKIDDSELTVLEKYGFNKPYLHLGKSSCGWCFLFQGYKNSWYMNEEVNISSWDEWRQFILDKDLEITDEYGEIYSLVQFEEMIIAMRDRSSHVEWELNDNKMFQITGERSFYQFGDYEFSFRDFS